MVAYHYFGTEICFFAEKILPILNHNATLLIGVPGLKDTYTGRGKELLFEWLGNDAYIFQSPQTWKEIIGNSDMIECVEKWEMECFDSAWNDWIGTDNDYTKGDKSYFDTHTKPYTCLVGIYIKIK